MTLAVAITCALTQLGYPATITSATLKGVPRHGCCSSAPRPAAVETATLNVVGMTCAVRRLARTYPGRRPRRRERVCELAHGALHRALQSRHHLPSCSLQYHLRRWL
jgi:hypothetical protein